MLSPRFCTQWHRTQFWRDFCFTLVRFGRIASNRTHQLQAFHQRGSHGSTKTGRRRAVHPAGRIMVLAMHAGFAFLELGTVRRKNQVNALVKILVDFSVSTVVYFIVGYGVAYGTSFFVGRRAAGRQKRLRAGEVLLFADLCRSHSGHHFGRHCRARQVLAATDCNGGHRGLCLPVL
jgi:hypothetical protein